MKQILIEEKYRENEQRCSDIRQDLSMLRKQLENYQVDEDNYTEKFDNWLDDNHLHYEIGELHLSPSDILKKMDITAYYCWLSNFADQEFTNDKTSDSGYVELEDMICELEDELQTIINEMHPHDIY